MTTAEFKAMDNAIPATGHPSALYRAWADIADVEITTFETTADFVPPRMHKNKTLFVRHSNGISLWQTDASGDARMQRRYDNEIA